MKKSEKINLADFKPKNNSIKLDSLKAKGLVSPFSIGSDSMKRLYELVKIYPNRPFPYYPNHPEPNMYEVIASIKDFKKLAKNKIVGDIFIASIKNTINLRKIREKEYEKKEKIYLMKIELRSKNENEDEMWMIKSRTEEKAKNKAVQYFKKNYSNGITGKMVGFQIANEDEIQNCLKKDGSLIRLWRNYDVPNILKEPIIL